MNNISFGIFCFGDEFYFKGTKEKIDKILSFGFKCYVLTDAPVNFEDYKTDLIEIIHHRRVLKSYHDKMILPKYMLDNHDIVIILDADNDIRDYSFLKIMKNYKFKKGISYISTLMDHRAKIETIKGIDMSHVEWKDYADYAESLIETFADYETIWEYFLVINKNGFNQNEFYSIFEKLQTTKENIDIINKKNILAAGEGISITIAAKKSESILSKDLILRELLKDKILPISRMNTPVTLWPDFMK
jgi:hypothetical protein